MVSLALKKIAQECGLQIAEGVAYGVFRGYVLTLEYGKDAKRFSIAAALKNEAAQAMIRGMYDLKNKETKKLGIADVSVTTASVAFGFRDVKNVQQSMFQVLGAVIGALETLQVPGAEYCSHCGRAFGEEAPKSVMIGGVAYQMHAECVPAVETALEEKKREIASKGSVATGFLGAVLGGLICAIPWAVVYYFGYVASILGFLIGAGAQKGYEIFKGKNTRAKAFCVIIATVLGVLVAECGAIIAMFLAGYAENGMAGKLGFNVMRQIRMAVDYVLSGEDTIMMVVKDVGLGLLFAALGIREVLGMIFSESSKKNNALIRLD